MAIALRESGRWDGMRCGRDSWGWDRMGVDGIAGDRLGWGEMRWDGMGVDGVELGCDGMGWG